MGKFLPKHGMYGTPTYKSWQKMKERCFNPKSNRYHIYGASGITVCERWMVFDNFFADMGERPNGTTLDRWPNRNGNYEPGNCRWATQKEQGLNRSTTRFLTIDGQTMPASDWAERVGIKTITLLSRIDHSGMTPEEAVSHKKYAHPKKPNRRYGKLSNEQIEEIFRNPMRLSAKELSLKFATSQSNVSAIQNGKVWRDITGEMKCDAKKTA